MTILVSYDIENDRLRLKTANKLLEYGLVRLQKSVFSGAVAETPWKHLLAWLQTEVVAKFETDDRLLYLPLSTGQAGLFKFLPAPPPEWVEAIDTPNTLIL